jgi:GT2 family glycosyltransferase
MPAGQPGSDGYVRSSSPATTVVMVTRNRREQTLNSLALLTDLTDGAPVIVVDNASSDGTADAVAQFFPAVRVIRTDRNLGAVGRNLGVLAAETELVAFADDDSWWAPSALTDAAKLFEEFPRLGLLAARIIVEPDGIVDPICDELAASPLPRADDLPGPSILGFVACGSVLRRQAFLQVGGFDPVVCFGGEESVVAWDLAAAGWGLAYVDGIDAYHHPLPTPERSDRARLVTRNAVLTAWLRRPLPVAWRQTVRMAARRGEPLVRAGLRDALWRLPRALRHRKSLPSWLESQLRLLEATGGR